MNKRMLGVTVGLMLLAALALTPLCLPADNAKNQPALAAYKKCRKVQAETMRLRNRIEELETQIKQKDAELANYRTVKARNAEIIKKLENHG